MFLNSVLAARSATVHLFRVNAHNQVYILIETNVHITFIKKEQVDFFFLMPIS